MVGILPTWHPSVIRLMTWLGFDKDDVIKEDVGA